ncbi:MAG: hypothetical protein RL754_1238 [Bacteroidota bacterium]
MKTAFFIAQKLRNTRSASVVGPLLKLSIVATALGMALVILSITSGKGLQQAIMHQFRSLEGDFTISAYSPTRTEELAPIQLADSLLQVLKSEPYTLHSYPVAHKMALLVNPEADVFDGIQVTGYDSARFARFTEQHRMLSADGTALGAPKNRYGAYISALMAKELNLVVGDTAVLTVMRGQHGLPRLRKAPVEGIFQTSLDEFDQGNLLMNIADVRRMAGIRGDSVSAYVVEVKNPEEREILAAYWNALVPYDVQVRSVDERHPAIFGWLKLFDTNIALVLSIVLIVALANLVTALLVLIIDRTQMIGTLKALGGSDRMILRVFQWMSLKILGRGLLWGNGIGLFLSWVQFQFGPVQLDPATYYIATAPIAFDWVWILGANAGFLVFAYLVLLLPVRWIARLQPIKSIRFA